MIAIVCADNRLGEIIRPIVYDDYRSNVTHGTRPEHYELTELEL